MSNEWGGRWLDRLGQVAAATVTPSQPQPIYGAAIDIATAPLTPQQYEDALNAIQTIADDKHTQQMAVRELTPAEADEADGEDDGFSPLDLIPFGDEVGEGLGKVGDVVGGVWGHLSGVDDETGLNRTERKWLEAQAGQDSDIGLQHDTEVFPELRAAAAGALRSGEWTEELYGAYVKYQGDNTGIDKMLVGPLEKIENFYQTKIARPLSTVGQVLATTQGDLTRGELPDVPGLFEAETWREAWNRTQHVTPGQSVADLALMQRSQVEEAYEAGFDEFGNPLNQAYYDIRKSPVYNITSGVTDFTVRWYADPLVIGGKVAGSTRAIVKADWDRMPAWARQRIEHIVSTPNERWNEMRASISKLDPIGQRAVRMREQMDDLTTKIRTDPVTHDEVWMTKNVPAFKDDLLAAGLWRELTLAKRQRFNPATGKMEDVADSAGQVVYDDEVLELGRAAMFGNGKARAELVNYKEADDYLTALTQDQLDSLSRYTRVQRDKLEDILTDPNLTGYQRWERAYTARESIEQSALRAQEMEGQLAQYDSFHRFVDAILDSPDSTVLRYGQFKPRARRTNAITSHTFRPSKASNLAVTATVVPRAPWLKRSTAIDLSGHGSLQEQAPRILNETVKASDVETLTALSIDKGFDSFEGLRTELLNQAARARTDVERRAVAQRIENFGIEAVAAKHGMTKDEALLIGAQVQGRRGELFAEARRQADQAKAMGIADDDIRRYTYADGNTVHHTDFPISLTQLQNYFVPIGVRDLDRFLTRHGEALKNSFRSKLYKAQDVAVDALELFNSWWKPAVLFRFGYPARTVSEEQFRILAHTGSWQTMLQDLPRAMGVGVVNTGKRVANRTLRHYPALSRARGARFQIKDQSQLYGEDVWVEGQRFSGAMAPGRADLYEKVVSSGKSQDRMFTNFKTNLNKLHEGNLPTRKTLEGETGHVEAWHHVLTNQVANDPIWLQMLAGRTDDEIVAWLRRDAKGREAARRNPRRGSDPEQWVDDMRRELDTLVPDDVLRTKLAAKERIELDELRRIVDDPNRNSPVSIDEAALQFVSGKGSLAEAYNSFIEHGYKVLAQIPTDVLARNPFFSRQYRAHLSRQMESIPGDYALNAKQVAAFERQSREFALKQVRRYLFNLGDETDLVHYMRFVAPFMGAWKESMLAWSRVFTENPENFMRMVVNGWQSMDDLYFVEMVDQNGRTKDDPDHGELDTLMVSMPKGMLKTLGALVPGFSNAVDTLQPGNGAVRMPIRKQTLNTTLQGDPFWLPGNGALVQLGGSFVLGDQPEFADENSVKAFLHKYLFPTGVPKDIPDALLPTLAKRVRRFAEDTQDPVLANLGTFLHKSEMYEWEQNGRVGPRPDPLEAKEKAGAIQAFYVVGALGSPFSFELQGENQFFVDMAHRYKEEHGFEEGYKKFIEDFGEDAYLFWYSNSKSKTGVPPTSAGFKMSKKHRELLERYPDIGLAVVGLDTQDAPFNYAVYQEQRRQGDRETLPTVDAVAKAEASQGWEEFRAFNVAIEAELAGRGLTSIQMKDAQDLAYLKRMFINDLRGKYPGWGQAYDEIDRGKSYEIVNQFRAAAKSGDLADRPEWEGVAEYLEIHDAVAAELDARRAAGGSANIETEGNADLFFIYHTAVGELRQRNLMFADVYTRFLDNHSLTNGSNGGL